MLESEHGPGGEGCECRKGQDEVRKVARGQIVALGATQKILDFIQVLENCRDESRGTIDSHLHIQGSHLFQCGGNTDAEIISYSHGLDKSIRSLDLMVKIENLRSVRICNIMCSLCSDGQNWDQKIGTSGRQIPAHRMTVSCRKCSKCA